jgi:hypothetical protein
MRPKLKDLVVVFVSMLILALVAEVITTAAQDSLWIMYLI